MKIKLETVRYIDPKEPMVALTFDDGPSPVYTPEILKALRENNAKATFFVLGTEAELNPDLLKQIAESGNETGNHTYSHLDLTKLVEPALDYQVLTTQEIIRRETGQAPILLRPPYGSVNDAVKKFDMPIILWSIDSLDWQNKNPDVIYNRVLNNIKNGDIILMHDIYKTSAEAASRIIPELKRRGYQLVTVSELARARGIPLKPGNVYGNLYPLQP
ncbi:MAG TPA: polysaccharide deacetylase family protein [Anaerovoracaceae bacterium]|nr:polysaccharide deacetylase family protein [Anaerovoracaceae bacterium]